MWILMFATGVISAVFASKLALQWSRKRRPQQAAWGISLAMFAIASGAAAGGILFGWNPSFFRTYYYFGAIVNVPILAAGTIYLLAPRRLATFFAFVCIVAAGLAFGITFSAPLEEASFAAEVIPPGKEAWPQPAIPRTLSRTYSYGGFAIVAGGAAWSAWKLARKRQSHLKRLATGNALIALGTTSVAAAGGLARVGRGLGFSLAMLLGISLMFWGFLRTNPRPTGPGAMEETKELVS